MKKHDAKGRLPLSTKLAALATLLLLFIGSTFRSSHAEPVRISVSSTDLAYLATAIAWKRRFFADEGLNVEIIRMNANVAMTALVQRRCELHDVVRHRRARGAAGISG
jgi:ABC-type nitrate/sulfonate/bicarbonate transport system substrate-binding protein